MFCSIPFSSLDFSGEIDTVLSHRLTKVSSSETKSSHIHQHQENTTGILSSDNEPTTSKPNQVDIENTINNNHKKNYSRVKHLL